MVFGTVSRTLRKTIAKYASSRPRISARNCSAKRGIAHTLPLLKTQREITQPCTHTHTHFIASRAHLNIGFFGPHRQSRIDSLLDALLLPFLVNLMKLSGCEKGPAGSVSESCVCHSVTYLWRFLQTSQMQGHYFVAAAVGFSQPIVVFERLRY